MNTIIIIMSENTESKNMSWAEAVAIVQEEQGGYSPLLLAKQIQELYSQLDNKLEQLDETLENVGCSPSTKREVESVIDWGFEANSWSETLKERLGQ